MLPGEHSHPLPQVTVGRLAACGRPLVAGALAGVPGGIVFLALTVLLIPSVLPAVGSLLGAPGLGWLVELLCGAVIGSGFGLLLDARAGGWMSAASLGAAYGTLWWIAGSLLLMPIWLGEGPQLASALSTSHLLGLACYVTYGVVTGMALQACRALRSGAAARPQRLDVYVAAHCTGCSEAYRLAAAVARRFPRLRVRVIDVARPGGAEPIPEWLVAVPTYALDGAVISLGNPAPEALFARIEGRSRTRTRRVP
jgi:hypothetical protein